MYTVLKLFWPFEGNREADAAPSENGFDTPDLKQISDTQVTTPDQAPFGTLKTIATPVFCALTSTIMLGSFLFPFVLY